MKTVTSFAFSLAWQPFCLFPVIEAHVEVTEDDELGQLVDEPAPDSLA